MSNTAVIVNSLRAHLSTIQPGKPFHFGSAYSYNNGVRPDAVPQGDLYVVAWKNEIPQGYVRVEENEINRQIAIEAGVGSHHRIRSWKGVEMYRPANWGANIADLNGPFIRFTCDNAIVHEPGHEHPHGTVFIDDVEAFVQQTNEPRCVRIFYQRNLDAMERAVRARD